MPLADQQVQIRSLVMGPGTNFCIINGFNPFVTNVRATATGENAWGHGNWSGSEWIGERTVPIIVGPYEQDGGISGWLPLHFRLSAAFRAVEDSPDPVECRFSLGGREFLMFGRPRMVEPDVTWIGEGLSVSRCAFVALDPRIYDGAAQQETIGLPVYEGGLTVPFSVPFSIDAEAVAGEVDVVNEGTADSGLLLKVNGPVQEPVIGVRTSGETKVLRYNADLPAGRFLLVDTYRRTALLDGLLQSDQRGQMTGDWPLLPGNPEGVPTTSKVLFRAARNDMAGTLELTARSAWW